MKFQKRSRNKKIRKRFIKNDKKDKKDKTVVLLLQEVMPLRSKPLRAKKNSNVIANSLEKTFLRLLTITIISKVTTLGIVVY